MTTPRTGLQGRQERETLVSAPRSGGLGSVAGDLALAIPRGVEDFGRDLVGLIPGVDTSGPRLVDRLFDDEEDTTLGRLASGIVNFMAGFVPGVGLVGKFGKIGRYANLTFAAERQARGAGQVVRATSISLGRGAAAGVLADFTAFDGNEERLSNLLVEFPILNNHVTRFLAADEDDPELIGRMKQVLEGLGAGFLADGLLLGLRGLRAQRASRARLASTPRDAAHAVDEAVPAAEVRGEADRVQRVLRREDALEAPRRPVDSEQRVLSGERTRRFGDPPPKEQHAQSPEGPVRGDTPAEDRAVVRTLSKTQAGRRRLLKERLRMTDDQMRLAFEDFERRAAQGSQMVVVDEKGVAQVDPFINPRNFPPEALAMLGVDPSGMNLSRVLADEDFGFLVRSYEAVFGPLPRQAQAEVPNAATVRQALEDMADLVGAADPGDLLPRLVEEAIDQPDILRQVTTRGVGLRSMLVTVGSELLERVAQDGDGLASMARFVEEFRNLGLLSTYVREGKSEAGRLLQSHKILAERLDDLDTITRILGDAGGEDEARRMLEILQMGFRDNGVEGAASMIRLANMSLGQRILAVTNEFWINSILSAARTFATNLMSPGLHSAYIPLENMVGGAILHQPPAARRAFEQILGMGTEFMDSMRMGAKAFRAGHQFLDPLRSVRDDPFARNLTAMDPRVHGVDPDSAWGHALTWFGRVVNLPTRLLMASDEVVKQMNYRAVAKSRLRQEAIEQGLSAPAAAAHISDGMARLTEEGQAYTMQTFRARAEQQAVAAGITDRLAREQFVMERMGDFDPGLSRIAQEGLNRANEAALTTELPPGSLSKGWQNYRNQHPFLILVTPFVRTPVNIAKAAARRVPNPWGITDAYLNRNVPRGTPAIERLRTRFAREVLSGDPDRAAQAVGRQAFGIAGSISLMTMAAQGWITGRGPTDKEQRDLFTAAGWQPYSVRVGDRWFSYLRLDPWATAIGTVADLYDYARLAPQDEQENLATAFMAVGAALANNFTNKTYLQGLSDWVDAISDPPRKMPGVLARYASSVVPNALAQAVEVGGDDTMRDIHTLSERIRSRIPGVSDTVPPMRNLFGEPMRRPRGFALGLENLPGPLGDMLSMMSPISYRDVSDEEIGAEFIRLKHGFSPPAATRMGIDLLAEVNPRGQSAWDRWLQLHGMVRVGGRTMKAELRRLIRSGTFQRMSDVSTTTATSPRVSAVGNVITEFRDEAWEQMLREFPSVRRQIEQRGRSRRAFLAERRARRFDLAGVVPTVGNIGGR